MEIFVCPHKSEVQNHTKQQTAKTNAEGYEYSLAHNAEMKNIDADEYMESLNLLDNEEREDVFDQFNVSRKNKGRVYAKDIDKLKVSSKIPLAYNYIDQNTEGFNSYKKRRCSNYYLQRLPSADIVQF